jgi:tetratricopeptide (TPR) repeat protein
MVKPHHTLMFVVAILILWYRYDATRLPPEPVQGYQAYVQGDYDTALREYEAALARSNDPGRYAVELGAIAAQAGRYSEASQWFNRTLEDAEGDRLLVANYGQATALTHVGAMLQGKRAVGTLERAIAGYRQALPLIDERDRIKKEDIEHNLNIAIALLKQKQAEPEPPPEQQEPTNGPPPSLTNDGNGPGNPRTGNTQGPRGNANNTGTNDQENPGRGNLPALPDDEKVPPISPEEAQRRLQDLLRRLRQPLVTTPMKPGTRDW